MRYGSIYRGFERFIQVLKYGSLSTVVGVGEAGPGGASKGEQTRRAVLEAAILRFGREGFRATSVADVARDAGVGGTVPYAYFPNKEALFLAAIDEDAARLIDQAVPPALAEPVTGWPQELIRAAVAALEERPLARRILGGLEPEVTARVLEIPALEELRKTAAERLRADQACGKARPDMDPVATAGGVVTIMLSLLMSVVQVGVEVASLYGPGVAAVLEAATGPVEGPPAGEPITTPVEGPGRRPGSSPA